MAEFFEVLGVVFFILFIIILVLVIIMKLADLKERFLNAREAYNRGYEAGYQVAKKEYEDKGISEETE